MYPLTRYLLSAGLVLHLGLPMTATAAEQPSVKKPFPALQLDKPVRGITAVSALGDSLPAVAAWYGKSPSEFAKLLHQDSSLWLDLHGRVHFIEEELYAEEPATTAEESIEAPPALVPLEQTFMLHSKPGAKRTIYLDFDGEVITNTAWNSARNIPSIDAKPYDLNSDPANFSDSERLNIQHIWQRVAEDYAPFDIDVTTERPAPEVIARLDANDATFGTRAIISRDWTSATTSPCNCGGIAYVGVFDETSEYYKPAWVFWDKLGNGNVKYVAEAIAHEIGHNLGLYHDGYNDGSTSQGYFGGFGSGATGWAPIMGVGYYKELTQWSKGEYAYATNKEDDLLIIQNNGGVLRADDHANDTVGSTLLTAVDNNGTLALSGYGVLSHRNDVDVFLFNSATGNITLNLLPFERGADTDLEIGLYDANGVLLATANPADMLGATLSLANAAEGTYYVRVNGVGKGDPANGGYSDYASQGYYSISGSAMTPTDGGSGGESPNSSPVAVIGADKLSGPAPLTVNFSASGTYDPDGDNLSYQWNFGDGATASGANASHTYSAVGSHVATLTVTDSRGASDIAQTTIEVSDPPLAYIHVSNIAMTTVTKRSSTRAYATVSVLDASDKVVQGATVAGNWSGVVSGSSSGVTGKGGTVKLSSPSTTKSGIFTFTITGISIPGYTYDATQNTETSDSITR